MSFPYVPFPQGSKSIRLLALQPGRTNDQIRCTLRQYSFPPRDCSYESLSYCWGDVRRTIPITMDGCSMKVTRNLHAALLHLRRKDVARLLWVDAVCINQKDSSEKSEQVQMMREIYQQGSGTLVWLGKLPPRARLAFQLIPDLVKARETSQTEADHLLLPDFRALLELPYFTRIWVVQEIAVSYSVDVICGRHSVPWDDLATAVSVATEFGSTDYGEQSFHHLRSFDRFQSMSYARSRFQANDKLDWLRLLGKHRSCSATNSKDKVYALLGLADPETAHELGIVPDYRHEYTIEEAFTDTAESILRTSTNLDLLSIPRASARHSAKLCLPTWVPDWSKPSSCISFLPLSADSSFAATKNSTSHPEFRASPRQVGLWGYTFDEVDYVGHCCADKPAPHIFRFYNWFSDMLEMIPFGAWNLRAWKNWRHQIRRRFDESYVNGKDMPGAFWKTVTCGYSFQNEDESRKALGEWEQFIGDGKGPLGVMDCALVWFAFYCAWAIMIEMKRDFLWWRHRPILDDEAVQMSYGRSMFTTRDKYIGLGPKDVQTGDCLVFLEGGRVPYVLRQKSNAYEFVGDCYIYGVMQGERFANTRCGRLWLV